MSLTVTVKEIKPQKLKVDAIRKEILNALRTEGTVHKQELRKTVETWRNKPQFESLIGLTGSDMTVVTGPTGNTDAVQHWVWTDKGTRRHQIRARNAPALRFQVNYSAKTQSRKFASYPGGSWGPWRRPRAVMHPGTKPREWSETLSKQRKTPFRRAMFDAIKRGADNAFG